MEIWRKVVIGQYRTVNEIKMALYMNNIYVNWLANAILHKIPFNISPSKEEINLVKFSVGELGSKFSNGGSFSEIYDRVIELGLTFGTDDIAPLLRIDYSDQSKDEVIYILPDNFNESENKFFRLENGFSGLSLFHYFIGLKSHFLSTDIFVCVKLI